MQKYFKRPSLSTPTAKGILQKTVGIFCSMRQKSSDKRHGKKKFKNSILYLSSQISLLNSVFWPHSNPTLSNRICGKEVSPIVKEDAITEHLSQLYPKTGKTSLPFKNGNKDDLVNYRLVCKRTYSLPCVCSKGDHTDLRGNRDWTNPWATCSSWVWLEQDVPTHLNPTSCQVIPVTVHRYKASPKATAPHHKNFQKGVPQLLFFFSLLTKSDSHSNFPYK